MAATAIVRVAVAAVLLGEVTACVARPPMRAQAAPGACSPADTTPPLAWIGPADPDDRIRLDRACRRIQGPLIRDWSPGVMPPGPRLVVASWNAHAGAGDVGAFVEDLRRGRFTGGDAESLFVVLVQEAARDFESATDRRDFSSVSTAARDARLFVAYLPGMRNGGRAGDRGIAILSSLPLTAITAIELPFERQRRVALLARVSGRWPSGEPWRLSVASVHLDLGLLILRGGGDTARARQSAALIDALATASDDPTPDAPFPLVVGGDFNLAFEASEPAARLLERVYPDARQPRRATWKGPLGLQRALDRIFARLPGGRADVRIVEPRFGSDHHPLITVLSPETLRVSRLPIPGRAAPSLPIAASSTSAVFHAMPPSDASPGASWVAATPHQ